MIEVLSFEKFDLELKHKSIVLVGAGQRAKRILDSFDWNICFAIDRDSEKNGMLLEGIHKSVYIRDWAYLTEHYNKECVFLVSPGLGYRELAHELEQRFPESEVHVLAYMEALQWDMDRIAESNVHFDITQGVTKKIPQIIHYFWFSGDPYPDKVKRCLDSWHKYCPDYEFKLWDLNNYKTDNVFCNEALSKRVWAFASDFGRCDVLYRYGGIYLDLDVELLKPLDDLLYDEGFFCFESENGVDPGSGMGCVKGNPVFKEICQKYEGIHFINEDGSLNKVNILNQYTSVLENHGLKKTGYYQNVEGIAVYPPLVFSPYSYKTGIDSRFEKTYGVHHWVSAWITEEEKVELEERKNFISSYVKENGGLNAFL